MGKIINGFIERFYRPGVHPLRFEPIEQPVMVDPGMGLKSLKTCLAEAAPEAFIGIPKAHAARVVLGWGKDTVRHKVTAGRKLFWGGTTLDRLRAGTSPLPSPSSSFTRCTGKKARPARIWRR